MKKRYTEGIAFDGAAILDEGQPITITEILDRLNVLENLTVKKKKYVLRREGKWYFVEKGRFGDIVSESKDEAMVFESLVMAKDYSSVNLRNTYKTKEVQI